MPVIYHYTDKPGRNAIYKTNMIKATQGSAGLAVYFTELQPLSTSKEDLIKNNYESTDTKWLERTRYWFKFDSEDYAKIKKMDWEGRNVWIHPGDIKLHEKSMIELYHYTDKVGRDGIYSTGVITAKQPSVNDDARGAEKTLPKGVYFTEMKPTAGKTAVLWNAFGSRDLSDNKLMEKTRYWFKFSVHSVQGVYKRPTYKNRNEWVCPDDVRF